MQEKKLALQQAEEVEEFNSSANKAYEVIVVVMCALAGLVLICCLVVFCHLKRKGVYIKKVHQPTKQSAAEITITD